MDVQLIQKYNVPGPRYTSYPTVPHWNQKLFSIKNWKENLKVSFSASNQSQGISIYIHLPFCESLCTFCGCNKRITKQHQVEEPYINTLLKEWCMYLNLFDEKPVIKQLHLGGGTPTFFSPENLQYLLTCILSTAELAENTEFSFEGHPNNTTKEHLETLYQLGFRRVSFGVQDYNSKVQNAIHRIQPFENVQKVTNLAREIGYTSVGHDIIYGLPFQTLEDVFYTIQKTQELKPDSIAFYSYAHVPWIKGNGQRGFSEEDLPTATTKLKMYELGKSKLAEAGYQNIGMDHFSLPSDELYQSLINQTLHRNFMGYTPSKTAVMVGLGVSSIGDSWNSFNQNVKDIKTYTNLINDGLFPIEKGHILTTEDLIIRKHILNIMCHYQTSWDKSENFTLPLKTIGIKAFSLIEDGLITIQNSTLTVTEKGKPFVRNICMIFDQHLDTNAEKMFSKTV